MKILVLGASGFVGRNLVLALPKDWDVTAIYYYSLDFPEWVKKNCPTLKIKKCDLSNRWIITHELGKEMFDVTVSLIANRNPSESFENPFRDFKDNALAVFNSLFYTSSKKFIFFSSGLIYEGRIGLVNANETKLNPTIPYAISKFSAEQYVKLAKKKRQIDTYYIIRFFGAFGPYQSTTKIYSKLVKTFGIDRNNNFIIKGDGHSLIDAMHVDDTVKCIINMINSDERDIIYDFSPRRPISILNLVKKAAELFSIEPKITFEGKSYETIDFYLRQEKNPFLNSFILLEDGLLKLLDWQKANINTL